MDGNESGEAGPECDMDVDRHSPVVTATASTTPERSIRALLDDPYYLGLVLGQLVDYGLHECRRVCRKWRDVCYKLPVKLGWVLKENIPAAVARFPNAVKLHSYVESDFTIRNAYPRMSQQSSDQCMSLFSCLRQTRNLENLVIDASARHEKWHSWNFCDMLGPHYEKAHWLRTLEISLKLPPEDYRYTCSQIQFLTNLTSLTVYPGSNLPDTEPFTGLQKIERLEIHDLLTNSTGQLMFPSLTNLTWLSFGLRDEVVAARRGRGIEVTSSFV